MSRYGECGCGGILVAVWYEEVEYAPYSNTETGNVRTACSHLSCTNCGHNVTVDDSFDRPWRNSGDS